MTAPLTDDPAVAAIANLQRQLADMRWQRDRYKALAEAAEQIFRTFSRDEEQGYHSRDRQYAITLLKPYLPSSGDRP